MKVFTVLCSLFSPHLCFEEIENKCKEKKYEIIHKASDWSGNISGHTLTIVAKCQELKKKDKK